MNYLSILARAAGIGLFVWLLGRAIRTAHPLDRAGSTLRWSVISVSAGVYFWSLRDRSVPEGAIWTAIFAFTLFFFLPDVSYYIVLATRRLLARIRNRQDGATNRG